MSDASVPSGPWGKPSPSTPFETPPVETPPVEGMGVDFVGRRGALFWLALKTGFWTILTLGFYRFWMKTRLRRWYWSSIRPGGHPIEYVGDPFEKLLGFFIAVVILTFYIGIVNLLLMFASFSFFNSSWVGYIASFAGVIPLWFYASYRARRYVLGRTRWRGVRFGLEKGAWGYAGRALLHWFLTIISLGILWPRMTFLLEKYRTDRTYFGSAKLVQGGRWPMLYKAAIPLIVSLIALLGTFVWLYWLEPLFPEGLPLDEDPWAIDTIDILFRARMWLAMADAWRLWLIPLFLAGIVYGGIHYRWVSKRLMANHKTADGIAFASTLKGPRISLIYVLGTFISYMVLVMGISLLVVLGVWFLGYEMLVQEGPDVFSELPRWIGLALLGVVYLGVFLLWGVLHNAFVTFPIMRHMAITTTLPDIVGLAAISQRARDEFAEAEGFAEALDLGAAI